MSSPVQSLPDAWVERIWSAMRATYGASFDRQWQCPEGEEPARHVAGLKAHWARELGAFLGNPDALRHGLENLPPHTPNLVEFREICRARPDRPVPELPAPPADAGRVAEALGKLRAPQGASLGYRVWAVRLREREQAGEPLSLFARAAWREVLQVPAGGAA